MSRVARYRRTSPHWLNLVRLGARLVYFPSSGVLILTIEFFAFDFDVKLRGAR